MYNKKDNMQHNKSFSSNTTYFGSLYKESLLTLLPEQILGKAQPHV